MKGIKTNPHKNYSTIISPTYYVQGKIQDLCPTNQSSIKQQGGRKTQYDDYSEIEIQNSPKPSFFKVKITPSQANQHKSSPRNKNIKSKVLVAKKPQLKPQYNDKFHQCFDAKPSGSNFQHKVHFIHPKLSESGESIPSLNSAKSIMSAQSEGYTKLIEKKKQTDEKKYLLQKPTLINSPNSTKLHSCQLKSPTLIHAKSSSIKKEGKMSTKIRQNFKEQQSEISMNKGDTNNKGSFRKKVAKANSQKETKKLQSESMRIPYTKNKNCSSIQNSLMPLSCTTELSGKNNMRKSTESSNMCKSYIPKAKGLASLSLLKRKQNLLSKKASETFKIEKITSSISFNRSSISPQHERTREKSFSLMKSPRKVPQSPTSPSSPKKIIPSSKSITLHLLAQTPSIITFTLIKKLAQHALTSTYICHSKQNNSLYCLKQCKVNEETVQQLIVESKIGLEHDCGYLLRVYGIGFSKQTLYLIIEYMQGGTLRQKLLKTASSTNFEPPDLRKRVPNNNKIAECQELFYQILMALQDLHNRGIVHRDIKPENIFITHNWNYKLGDFGSSTYSLSQEYVGTLDYAAPEILTKSTYDKSIDMWSLGCVMYEFMVGEPPFYHEQRNETIRRILSLEYSLDQIEDISLKDLIGHLLLQESKNRLTVQQALQHPFLRSYHTKRTRN